MQFRLIRQHPDGHEEVSDFDLDIEYAHTGRHIDAEEPGKAWEIRQVDFGATPPTIKAVLVADTG